MGLSTRMASALFMREGWAKDGQKLIVEEMPVGKF